MYYNVLHMRVSKTFRLSEEAVDVLNKQENATQFIEDLILGKLGSPGGENSTPQIKEAPPVLEIDNLDEYILEALKPLEDRVTKLEGKPLEADPVANMARACCLNKTKPCVHWSYDGLTEKWTNVLTGEIRNA